MKGLHWGNPVFRLGVQVVVTIVLILWFALYPSVQTIAVTERSANETYRVPFQRSTTLSDQETAKPRESSSGTGNLLIVCVWLLLMMAIGYGPDSPDTSGTTSPPGGGRR